MTKYEIPDSPKMLRETLCLAQSALLSLPVSRSHIETLQRLINECDRLRPLGTDGKHGNLHTFTPSGSYACGCEVVCHWHRKNGQGYTQTCKRCNP